VIQQGKQLQVRLTQKVVDRAPISGKRYWFGDTIVRGLRLMVYENGAKRWQVRYRVGRGEAARECCKTIGDVHAMSLEQARARAAEVRAAGRQGRDLLEEQQPVNELTVRGLWEEFVAEIGQHWSEGTRRLHAGWDDATVENGKFRGVAAIFLDAFGNRIARTLQRAAVVKLHSDNGWRPTMANKCVILLQMYKWARDTRRLRPDAEHPCDPAVRIRLHDLEESPGKEYTDDELGRIGVELLRRPQRDRVFVLLLAFTGMRPGELLGLRLEQIDLTMRLIHLGRKKVRDAKQTKTKRSRVVPIVEPVYGPLVEYLETLPVQTRLLFPSVSDPKVPVDGSVMRRVWVDIAEAAGVEGRLYDLRHTFVTRGTERSLFGTQRLVGHTQVKTTQGYVHPRVAVLQDVAEGVGSTMAPAMLGNGEVM
jgi:integrase